MSCPDDVYRITVPGQREALVPPAPDRVRAFRRHLIEAIRDLAKARRPERLIQRRGSEPTGFQAKIVGESCGLCQGSCCMAGGTHAFLDDRTMARVHKERPEMTVRQVISAYVGSIAPLAYRGSCLFHGQAGCTLDRTLRAELCNSYYCNGLKDFLKADLAKNTVVEVVTHAGDTRRVGG